MMRLLSLGAGVQSTTLALMACDGTLPKVDGAIFADTGWEPKRVYEHLDRLEQALTDAGIPLYRVSRGNLRDDVLSPYTQAGIPFFSLAPLRRMVVIDETMGCPALCGWAPYLAELSDYLDAAEDEDGAGDDLDVPHPPEPCEGCGNRGQIVTRSHVEWRRERGMGTRRCTGRYKVEPIERQIRLLLGAKAEARPCRFCEATGRRVPPWEPTAPAGPCSVCRGSGERRIVGPVPTGAHATQWIGFSTDEIHRVGGGRFPSYITPKYPLLELGMSRTDCEQWLRAQGWTTVAKSACIGCPFHGNRQWRALRDTHPDEWADAVAFDAAFRTGAGLDGERFLHEARVPLDRAPIDRLSRPERNGQQGSLFDLVVEEGDPDGCSPYGCRSGSAVAA